MASLIRPKSRGLELSTVSAASSASPAEDGSLEKSRTRGSEDARSETSSHQRRMSRIFKGRKKRTQSGSQDDLAQFNLNQDIPPVPPVKLPATGPPNESTDSLGLARSVASSLLTEDSDSEA